MKINKRFSGSSGDLFEGDSLTWLKTIADQSVDLVFADPPYNLKKADWDNFESHEIYIKWSIEWIEEAARVLTPTGSLYVCGFSEILADIKHPASRFFSSARWIVWYYKNKANLGSDWGRSHESIIHFRKAANFKLNIDSIRIPYGAHTLKYPARSQAETSQYGNGKNNFDIWRPNPSGAKPKDVIEIPTTCNGMNEKTSHPTQKPEELLRTLILGASKVGDLVLDPFSGSGTTAVVCQQLQRKWIACERDGQYNDLAIDRLLNIKKLSIEQWIEHDRKNNLRRKKIR